MKKIILLAATVLFSTGAFAQIEWGAKAGLNLSSLTDSDHSKMKPSIYAGVFAEFTINDYLGIQPELVYSRQGNRREVDNEKYWNRFNYINLPILAKIYILEGLSIDLGPQFGVLVGAKNKTKIGSHSITSDIDNTKDFDVSFAMGASYKIMGMLDVSARYNLGFTKVNDWDGDKHKNGVLQVGVGVRF